VTLDASFGFARLTPDHLPNDLQRAGRLLVPPKE